MNSPGDLPDEAKIASTMIQSILYGIYFVLFIRTMTVLFRPNIMKTEMHRIMVATAIVMWITTTGHLSVSGVRVVRIFVQERSSDSGPAPSFNRFSDITSFVSVGLNLFQIVIGDGFLLYRMAVVWGRDWRIYVFPLSLLAASMVTAACAVYQLCTGSDDAGYFVDTRWIVSFIAMTLCTNISCTSLIAVKIWKINSFSAQFVGRSLEPVMLVVIESGAIYSCTLIALLVCYLTQSWAQYLVLDSVSPIVGCVFSMVIVRLGLGLCRPDGVTLDPAVSSVRWQSSRRNTSETLQQTTEGTVVTRDDPRSGDAVSPHQGQSFFPGVAVSSITEPYWHK